METRNCQNCKKDFTIEVDDFSFYEKIKVPPPTFCFHCRLQRKLSYINERALFKRECDNCKKSIISIFSSKRPFVVWCTECYMSDKRNELENGVEYDFSRPFFEQFYDLMKKVPRLHLVHKNNNAGGCEYANYTYRSKNIYLSFEVVRSEDIFYSKQAMDGNRICLDSMNIIGNERGYELIDSTGNYNCRFLVRSNQCIDSSFLINCRNCTDCCLSSNQQNKSYVFKNQQLSRDSYLEEINKLKLDTYSGQVKLEEEFFKMTEYAICRFALIKNCKDCTGNFLENSKNVNYSFDTVKSENAKYIVLGVNSMSDSYDMFYTGKMELCYEMANGGSQDYKVMFSLDIGFSQNIFYTMATNNSENLFGCIGLFGKKYCILNKQYTKEEYEELLPNIIKHMNDMPYVDKKRIVYKFGEYFPTELSFYSYNESLVYEEFPLSKTETEEKGYSWTDPEEKYHLATLDSVVLPDSISEIKDSVLEEVIACPNKGNIKTLCTFAFKITANELRFYRLMNIPLPRYCPNCRYYKRRKWKLSWRLWHRACMCNNESHGHKSKCINEFETSYAPDRPEIIYCEDCYKKEIY